jgi:hypothetical protein
LQYNLSVGSCKSRGILEALNFKFGLICRQVVPKHWNGIVILRCVESQKTAYVKLRCDGSLKYRNVLLLHETDIANGIGLLHTTALLCASLQITHVYILVVKPGNCLIHKAIYPPIYSDQNVEECVEVLKSL